MTISRSFSLSDDGADAMEVWIIVEPGSDTILAHVQKAACPVGARRMLIVLAVSLVRDTLLDLIH